MRRIRMFTLILTAALTIPLGAAQKDNRAEAQLQAAITKETVEGDRKGAIEQYKKLANSSNRAVAAKALVRMGECYEKLYEKLGDAEARKAYERVVRDFPDQKDALASAQKHLAANSAQSEAGIMVQRVAAYPDKRIYGGSFSEGQSISRDGRYLIFSKEDGVYVQDLTKGTERRIVPKASQQESFDAAIFPDGSQIVYERTVGQVPMNSRSELYVIGADGSSPRLLLGGKQGEILMLSAVSPDGRQLTYFLGKMEGDGIHGDLYVIDTDGSNPRLLASGEKMKSLCLLYGLPTGSTFSCGPSAMILVGIAGFCWCRSLKDPPR